MVENQTEAGALSFVRGAEWKGRPGSGVQQDVQEALDTELDAYLDRELFVQPEPEVKPPPVEEKPAERLQGVLALAAAEEQWLRTLPPPEEPAENSKDLDGGECPIPEHLKPKLLEEVEPIAPVAALPVEAPWAPPQAPLPGLAVAPHLAQPGWNVPVVPAPAVEAPNRTLWVTAGALVGVSAASLLVTGMLWMVRDSLPDRTQVAAAYVPAGTVAAVAPPPATAVPERVLSVKDSPLSLQSESAVGDWRTAKDASEEALPGPLVPGRVTASSEPAPQAEPAPGAIAQAAVIPQAGISPEPGAIAHAAQESLRPTQPTNVKSREMAQARKVSAAQAAQERRDIEDPSLEETEEEMPFMQQPAVAQAPAPIAKAAAESTDAAEPGEYEEFDKEFARELGFTKDAVRKVPESKGVKSVWIPPDPAEAVPESLTPEDVQKVVVTNQPAIASCIRRHKESIPGLTVGRFVMRWFVYPSGSTYGIAMETQALRGTALATCIEGLVRDWKFPQHQTQMGPIRFPFVF
ncbi:AgmX/PglI C-terminal domain-containing protein [Hyalangium gracile]|uniref:AgmX/PglI C-terminal domain-containing protein n=1 Tax=Hyalangium gracile TaxID=394092 RepID=UPI001CCCAB92|nr:AgmX/PglI C-terminal domain-containing protein [Hyalangium gracile]